jgi:hypothetical protein
LKGLSKNGGLIEFQVGMGDLDSDLIDLLDRAGVESKDFTPPPTVGELINEIAMLKEMILSKNS